MVKNNVGNFYVTTYNIYLHSNDNKCKQSVVEPLEPIALGII